MRGNEMTTPYSIVSTVPPSILEIKKSEGIEVIRIASNGDVFWKQRLVEADDDFKAAMLDLAKYFAGVL